MDRSQEVTATKLMEEARQKMEGKRPSALRRFWWLWRDGMKNMTWGKPLWILNIIKLIIMFGILKVFFFPNFLKSKSDSEEGRTEYVRQELIERAAEPTPLQK